MKALYLTLVVAFILTNIAIAAPPAPDECDFIRQALAQLPAEGGTITIPAGEFNCQAMIVVKANNTILQGAGEDKTILKLADNSPAPVLVIGDNNVVQDSAGNWVTATRVSNVTVSDLTVNGNMENQDLNDECGAKSCDGDVTDIRNNAITIRGASFINLNHVTTHSAISGGLVTEKFCDHLHIQNFTSFGNHFDGFAGYQTSDSLLENVNLSNNHGAGISIDLDFNNNTFNGGSLTSNGDVGIFARDISGVVFANLMITSSGNHGAFLADWGTPGSCANDNEFRSVVISGSKGYGIYIASPCTGNKVTGNSIISKNTDGCYFVDPATTMSVDPSATCSSTLGNDL